MSASSLGLLVVFSCIVWVRATPARICSWEVYCYLNLECHTWHCSITCLVLNSWTCKLVPPRPKIGLNGFKCGAVSGETWNRRTRRRFPQLVVVRCIHSWRNWHFRDLPHRSCSTNWKHDCSVKSFAWIFNPTLTFDVWIWNFVNIYLHTHASRDNFRNQLKIQLRDRLLGDINHSEIQKKITVNSDLTSAKNPVICE